jgi:hypothetical protein
MGLLDKNRAPVRNDKANIRYRPARNEGFVAAAISIDVDIYQLHISKAIVY